MQRRDMLNLTRKVTATGAATALVASGVALTTLTPRMAYAAGCTPTDAVTIFAINDFHGRISKAANLSPPSTRLAPRSVTTTSRSSLPATTSAPRRSNR